MFILIGAALAADPVFEGTEEIAVADAPVTKLSAEAGGALTTGNTDFWVITGTLAGSHRWNANKVSLTAAALQGRAYIDADGDGIINDPEKAGDRTLSAQRFEAEARYDRFFGEKNSMYVLAGALQDTFAGYDLRSHEQVGYSRGLIGNDTTELFAEVGFDYAQEFYVEGIDPDYQNIFAARVMLALSHKFNENVTFTDRVEVYENVLDTEDLRVLNTASLTTRMSDKVSFKLSHQLAFDNVPVTGYRKLDQTTNVSVVATFL